MEKISLCAGLISYSFIVTNCILGLKIARYMSKQFITSIDLAFELYTLVYMYNVYVYNYEWAKQTNFLLAILYRSPRRHSISSEAFKEDRKKCEIHFYDHSRISWIIEKYKPARPEPTVTLFHGLFLGKHYR